MRTGSFVADLTDLAMPLASALHAPSGRDRCELPRCQRHDREPVAPSEERTVDELGQLTQGRKRDEPQPALGGEGDEVLAGIVRGRLRIVVLRGRLELGGIGLGLADDCRMLG